MGDVLVTEDLDLCLREAGAVDDAGVVEFVGENEVFFAEDAGDRAGVGGEAGLEDDAGFYAFERCNLSSSSMWMCIVPAMVRTAPEPTPYFFVAVMAASSRRGVVAEGRGSCWMRG